MISNEDYLSPLLRKVVMIPLLVQIPKALHKSVSFEDTARRHRAHILYLLEDPNPIEEVKTNKFLMMHQSKG